MAHPDSGDASLRPGQDIAAQGRLLVDQAFDGDSLYALRATVAAHAAAAGLSPVRVHDVVAAAHELAANAVQHGAGQGRLRLLAAGEYLYCEVTDDGPAAADDGSAGDASWAEEHGHGLWLVRQVADDYTHRRGQDGTAVIARFAVVRAEQTADPSR